MLADIHDVIMCATFCDDRLRGLGMARGRISRVPIDLSHRPYNTLAWQVRVCDIGNRTLLSDGRKRNILRCSVFQGALQLHNLEIARSILSN